MSNMTHCRFENTAADLRDVSDNWDGQDNIDLSLSELRGKLSILRYAARILDDAGIEVHGSDFDNAVADIKHAIEAKEGH
jgi:hypothetical protein